MTVPAVVPYDPSWPEWFSREVERFAAVISPWTTTEVQHIGSTAIPGMPAKPVLDMMVGASDPAAAARALEDVGWVRCPHRVDAELAVAVRDGVDTAHLHLTSPVSDLWRERLAFRDTLRADPSLVAEYAELKRALLDASGGRPYAARDKQEFVQRVLERSGIRLKGDRHA